MVQERSIMANKNNLKKFRLEKGWSLRTLGEAIGADPATIDKLEKGTMRLSDKYLVPLANALSVSASDLLANQNIPQDKQTAQPKVITNQMIPVMGVAAGSALQGAMQITNGPIDYREKPRSLEHAQGVYALYVSGQSMEPMFRHGSLIIVSQYIPARIGNAVVVQEIRDGSTYATIGILEPSSPSEIKLRKLNPSALITIPATQVSQVHKIFDYEELLD